MPEPHLDFQIRQSTGKTDIFAVISTHSSQTLGEIRWFTLWRRYCFFPGADTLYDAECLSEIEYKINSLMQDRKK